MSMLSRSAPETPDPHSWLTWPEEHRTLSLPLTLTRLKQRECVTSVERAQGQSARGRPEQIGPLAEDLGLGLGLGLGLMFGFGLALALGSGSGSGFGFG